MDNDLNVYVTSDENSGKLWRIKYDPILNVYENEEEIDLNDSLKCPSGIDYDSDTNNLYITDSKNDRIAKIELSNCIEGSALECNLINVAGIPGVDG